MKPRSMEEKIGYRLFLMGFVGIILLLIVFQSTGRRGTFLSEEQICNCAVVPSCNVNSIKVKPLPNQPEINIGADL